MRFLAARRWRIILIVSSLGILTCAVWLHVEAEDSNQASAAEATGAAADRQAQIDDAVTRNGEIFADWPQPQAVLLFSGEMDGYLEPCGCAGLDNQMGGLKRRHTLIKQLAAKGWPVVPLDMGGQVRRVGPQAEMKYHYALASLLEMGYTAIGLGARDLQLNPEAILVAAANLVPELSEENTPLLSTNVGLFDFESGYTAKYRVLEADGKRIGVTAVLGKKHRPAIASNPAIAWRPPEQALREIVPQLASEKCDLLVLLVHADPEEATALARQFPQFRLVATTGGAEEPPNRFREIKGSPSLLIEAGHKGMYVIAVGLYDDRDQPFRFQRVPLDHRWEDAPETQAQLAAYQEELKGTGLAGLGLTGVKHARDSFIGSAACADCHTEATEVFDSTPHAHATQTLVDLDPPRHFDPECLSCHATGWEPQKYFPYASGFLGLAKTSHLTGNGCENCHGPGAQHVAAENGDVEADDAELLRLRTAMRLKIMDNEGNKDGQAYQEAVVVKRCMECHDLDNSPDFDFQEYWPQVEHYGKD